MALLFLLVCGAAAGQSSEVAPVSPEFEAWQQQMQSGAAQLMATGEASGYIPSPLDLSHLLQEGEESAAQPLNLQAVTPPSSYSLVDLGYVTPVRDQGECGSCWAFPAYGSLESWLLKNMDEEWDFSENHLKNYHGFDWGPCDGGNDDMSTAYLTRWSGPVDEMNDPYHDWDDRPSPGGPCEKHVEQVLWYTTSATMKAALMEVGALSVSLYYGDSYFNNTTFTYYCYRTKSLNHAVTLVGWDDAKSVAGAPGPGAWLVKNSWGADWYNNGYFWISYYDKNAVKKAYAYSNASDPADYQAIYQYDPLGCVATYGGDYNTTEWGANVFTATGTHDLSAVGFYALAHGTSYEIYVYKDFTCVPCHGFTGELLGSTSGTLTQAGYHTVALPTPIPLSQGDQFAIIVKFTTPGYNYPVPIEKPISGYSSAANAQSGQSFVSSNGTSWSDLTIKVYKANVCIKGLVAGDSPFQFSGTPDEYTYELEEDGDVVVTDTVPGRDGVVIVPSGTEEVDFLGEVPSCPGVTYNFIKGTNGDDVLNGFGTPEDDAAGLNNKDLILGFAGNDSLRGKNGCDFLFGGDGNDRLYGDNDNDYLAGGAGNDGLYAGAGDNRSYGQAGNDTVVLPLPGNTNEVFDGGDGLGDKLLLANGYGTFTMTSSKGFEKFAGGDGTDNVDWSDATVPLEMRGNEGNDTLSGGSANDALRGFAGDDVLNGNGGLDSIYGGDGNDTIDGGADVDNLYGENGDDTLTGGDGADNLYTGAGTDSADGGEGDDTVVLEGAGPEDSVTGGAGRDRLVLGNGYGAYSMTGLHEFEEFVGGDGNDTVDWSGATFAVTIRGNGGNDTLIGGPSGDLLTGGDGDDVLYGNAGADILYGEGGVNHLIGGAGNDGIRGGGSDIAHFSEVPAAPRYSVRDRDTYIVVIDTTAVDGTDTLRGCPIGSLGGAY